MAYTVFVSKAAQKFLADLEKKPRLRIVGIIDLLATNPFPPKSEKLKGREGYRIRVNDFRILYSVEREVLTVHVLDIGHRREIYRK